MGARRQRRRVCSSSSGTTPTISSPTKQDIATSDSIFLRQAPPAEAKDARTALRRLQESGVGVLIPASELKAQPPVPNAIAVFTLGEVPAVSALLRRRGRRGKGGHRFSRVCLSVPRLMIHMPRRTNQQGGEPALPEGAARYAVTLDGSESDAELQKLKALKPIMVLINVDAT